MLLRLEQPRLTTEFHETDNQHITRFGTDMLCISAILRYLIARHGHRAGFHGWDDIAVSVAGQRVAGFIAIHHLLWRNRLELSEEALVGAWYNRSDYAGPVVLYSHQQPARYRAPACA